MREDIKESPAEKESFLKYQRDHKYKVPEL